MMNYWGGGFGGIGMIWMLFFWIIIIVAVVLVIRWAVGSQGGGSMTGTGHESPLELLKKRYARGEISKEEFEQMKQDLR